MNFIIFSDEAGLYAPYLSVNSKNRHPFYIRGNLFIDINDYKIIQEQFLLITKKYNIPIDLEIKWSDLYFLKVKKNQKLKDYKYVDIEAYIAELVKLACSFENTKIFFTITDNRVQNQTSKINMLKYHLQEAYQRAEMDADHLKGFAVFVIDELNRIDEKTLKDACHELTLNGDSFVKYKNIYQGLFIDKSNQSVGLKIIDYITGAFNSFLKNQLINKNNYLLGVQLYKDYIRSSLRKSNLDIIYGYGVKYVPSRSPVSANFKNMIF